MTVGFVGSGLSVEIGFTSNVWATSVTWTDITRYVIGPITVTYGRPDENQQVSPSTATMSLENQVGGANGRFSPWNTASPYYNSGNGLTPGHPVRITQTISATTLNVFYGYTQSWVPVYGESRSTVTLNCYDGLALLALAYMDQDLYEPQVITDGVTSYWQCQDPVGSTTFADATGGGKTGFLIGGATFGGTGGALRAIGDSCVTFAGSGVMVTPIGPQSVSHVMFEGWFLSAGFVNQTFMNWEVGVAAGNLFGVSLGTDSAGHAGLAFGELEGGPLTSLLNSGRVVNDGQWHHLVVQVPCTDTTGTYSLWVDGTFMGPATAGSAWAWTTAAGMDFIVGGYWTEIDATFTTVAPAFSGSFDQIAYYHSLLTTAQINTHYQLGSAGFVVADSGARTATVLEELGGLPSGLVNCDTGAVQVQGATSLLSQTTVAAYLQQVVNTERGILYQDGTGVLQFKSRNHVYANAHSTTSQLTFTYDGTGSYFYSQGLVPAEDDNNLWNDINVSRQSGVNQNAIDSTSVTKYGRRSLTGYTSLLFEHDSDAADLAGGLLYQYKNPAPRVRAIKTSTLSNGMTGLAKILALNLLDRVTVIWKPIDASTVPFNQQSLVEQVTHTIQPGQWDTTLAVTPIGTEVFGLWNSGLWNTAIWGF